MPAPNYISTSASAATSTRSTLAATLTVILLALTTFAGILSVALAGAFAGAGTATAQGSAPVVIREGHVDFGPVISDGQLSLQLRDDTVSPPQWRNPQDIVLALGQASQQTIPEGKEFDFTGARGGQNVWVIPQTQKPGVPWLGWNTQSPTLQGAVDRGVTFTYEGHQGPGDFSLFLQDGGLNGPEKVFVNTGDTAWVDLGTHTHANWVFTEPGVHLVKLSVTAGDRTADAVLRFAVSESQVTDAEISQAAAEQWTGPSQGSSESNSSGLDPIVLVGIGLVVLAALIVAAALWLRRK